MLEDLLEFDLLSSFSSQQDMDLVIRGSLVTALVESHQKLDTARSEHADIGVERLSLFDYVPPLADIDIRVQEPDTIPILRSFIRGCVPLSGFFRWEFSSPQEIQWYKVHANLEIQNEPEIVLRRKNNECQVEIVDPQNAPTIRWIPSNGFKSEWAMRDLFYVAYRYASLLRSPSAAKLVAQMQDYGGRRIADQLRDLPGEATRLEIEMAKYLLAREKRLLLQKGDINHEDEPSLVDLLGKRFSQEFEDAIEANGSLVHLFRWCLEPAGLRNPVVAIYPVWEGDNFQRLAVDVHAAVIQDQGSEPNGVLRELRLLSGSQLQAAVVSPLLPLKLSQPRDPGGWKYRDFARGIAEIAWIDRAPAEELIEPGLAVIVPEQTAFGDRTAVLAHAYTTFGPVNAVRLDYGYASIVGDGARLAHVIATGYRSTPGSHFTSKGGNAGHDGGCDGSGNGGGDDPRDSRVFKLSAHANSGGEQSQLVSQGDNLVVVCHGMSSTAQKIRPLVELLQFRSGPEGRVVEPWTVVPFDYAWRNPVLISGIEFACHLLSLVQMKRVVALVGHSQGGLICRVAATALKDPRALSKAIQDERSRLGKGLSRHAEECLAKLQPLDAVLDAADKLKLVITLATPNSCSLSLAELSAWVSVFVRMGVGLAEFGGLRNLKDLSTSRLAAVLQHLSVDTVRYLSVSASCFNQIDGTDLRMFKQSSLGMLPQILMDVAQVFPILKVLAPRLSLPNDGIVEDASADLRKSVYRPELANLNEQHEHVRLYAGNTTVLHTSLYAYPPLVEELKIRIRKLFS